MLGNQDENMGQRGQHEIFYFLAASQKHHQHKPHLLWNKHFTSEYRQEGDFPEETDRNAARYD